MSVALAASSVKCGFPSMFGLLCVMTRLLVTSTDPTFLNTIAYGMKPPHVDPNPNPNPPLIPEEKAAGAEVATEMTKADTSAKAKLRAAVKAMSRDEHGRRGHMPHDPSCSVCVHARFRRAAVKKMEAITRLVARLGDGFWASIILGLLTQTATAMFGAYVVWKLRIRILVSWN